MYFHAVLSGLIAFGFVGCQPASQPEQSVHRYLVTESPIDVGEGIRTCIALDPLDEHGIWWWQPGESGCDSRSSGPGVFHAEEARVSPTTPGGPTTLGFRLGTHSTTRPFIDVRLVVEDGTLRALESGARATLQRRKDLDLPEVPVRGRRQAPDH